MTTIPNSIRSQVANGFDAFLRCSKQPKPLHLIYSSNGSWPYTSPKSSSGGNEFSWSSDARAGEGLDIAVLDSSFNPPHLAHLSLISSPPLLSISSPQRKHYDGHLLLLSSKNADKGSGKVGDASPEQRLSMMYLLAKEVEHRLSQDGSEQPNVAVGIVEEPLMKDKSTLLHQWFAEQAEQGSEPRQSETGGTVYQRVPPRLHWVVGWDTIIRFFALKYYPSPESFSRSCDLFFNRERTTFVCARRVVGGSAPDGAKEDEGSAAALRKEEDQFLRSDLVRPWFEQGSVAMFDLPRRARGVSSTVVRNILPQEGESDEEKLARVTEGGMVPQDLAKYLLEENVYR